MQQPAQRLACNAPLTYTGHLYDPETGLFYFGARYYDPETGRFLTHDPVAGDALNPPSLHRYLYAYSSPMTFTDAWGEEIDPFYRTKHQLETMGATRPKPVEKVGPFVIRARVNDKGEVIGYIAASHKTGHWKDYYLLDTTIDLANFRKNVARFGSSKLIGLIEQTQQKPEWMREFAYSAVMFWRGHLKETMRSVGRQWISALEDPLWWMSAAPATLTPFVGSASVGGAVIDGEGGEIRPVANPAGEAPATSDVAAEGSAPQSPGNSPRVSEGAGSSREYISNETTAEAKQAYAAEQAEEKVKGTPLRYNREAARWIDAKGRFVRVPKISAKDLANFRGGATPQEFGPGTKLYRITEPGKESGSYWTLERPEDVTNFRTKWAVHEKWNGASHIVEYTVPDGQQVIGWTGIAKEQTLEGVTLPGGGVQVWVPRGTLGGEAVPFE